MTVDPETFGEVKQKGENNEKRLDGFEVRFGRVESKIDVVKWLVVANMIGGFGFAAVSSPDTKEILISLVKLVFNS